MASEAQLCAFTLLLESHDPDIDDVVIGTISADVSEIASASSIDIIEVLGQHLLDGARRLRSEHRCACE